MAASFTTLSNVGSFSGGPSVAPAKICNSAFSVPMKLRKSSVAASNFSSAALSLTWSSNRLLLRRSGGFSVRAAAQGATIAIKLPRRSLLVHFTCNACGVRSQRLINRLAYEKGTVYVQCSGCSQYHKLVDNLNLVVEYDFRDTDLSTDSAEQARHGSQVL